VAQGRPRPVGRSRAERGHRLLVQRERERIAFASASYWDLVATLATRDEPVEVFDARLVAVDGAKVATGKDFTSTGALKESSRARGA
jgi:DNA topoisomerase I